MDDADDSLGEERFWARTAEVALYGRPTAEELLDAVREFLESEVMLSTEGRIQFHTRVSVRVLDTVLRQLALGKRHLAEHEHRLGKLGFSDDWDLVAAIRAGEWDDRMGELAEMLVADVAAKLQVADPRYLASGAR